MSCAGNQFDFSFYVLRSEIKRHKTKDEFTNSYRTLCMYSIPAWPVIVLLKKRESKNVTCANLQLAAVNENTG